MKRIIYFFILIFVLPITAHIRQQVTDNFMKSKMLSRSVPCTFTGPAAEFCNVNVRDQVCIGGNLNVAGIISGTVVDQGFGNVCRVDKVYGDDITGARNGAPFLTIQAALDAALPGDVVWVFPGVYEEVVTIPVGVNLASVTLGAATIQQVNVTEPTDLVTIGEGSFINGFVLILNSTEHVQLRGIVHDSMATQSVPTLIYNVTLLIDNSQAGAGSSDIYGIYMTGTGNVGFIGDFIVNGLIQVTSTGNGKKRGIYIDSPTLLELVGPIVIMFGGTDSIALETDNPAVFCVSQAGSLNGDFFLGSPDISQTQGTISLDFTYLGNSNASGIGFGTLIVPSQYIWGNTSVIGGAQTYYLRPGTAELADDPVVISASQKFLAKAITVHALVAPGLGETTTITVQRKTPSDMASVSLKYCSR